MIIDINKINLENIDNYTNPKFRYKKEELLYKLQNQSYVYKKDMKNISNLVTQLRKDGYLIKSIPKIGYKLVEKGE